MKINKANLIWAISIYFVGVVIYVTFVYLNTKNQLIEQVDSQLKTAAVAAEMLIDKSFHDNLVDENSVSYKQDIELAMRMTEYARATGIYYIYSLKKFSNGEIRFTSSSTTKEEVANNSYEKAYYTTYSEIPKDALLALETGETRFSEYQDRWGKMRSVFVPRKNKLGESYLIGADIPVIRINEIIFKSVMSAIFVFSFLAIIVIPLIYSFFKILQNNWKIKYDALFTDYLTGLPNRRQLYKDLKESTNTNLALININRFRNITATYGPVAGDQILKEFSCRLDNFKFSELNNFKAYRLYADEFAVLIDQQLTENQIKEMSRHALIYLIKYPYIISATENIQLDITAGVVFQKDEAFNLAEMALGEARRRNIRTLSYNKDSNDLPKIYVQNMQLISELKSALNEDRLVAYKQAIFNAKTFKLEKYELLARIVDNKGKVILLPDEFLPFAHKARVYYLIIRIMLMKAIDLIRDKGLLCTVNICVADINNKRTCDFIFNTLSKSNVADKIQFELLENEVIHDYAHVNKFIKKIKSYGSTIGIDDLGKGHSNFERLINLPVDFVKIDRSIMKYIVNDKTALFTIKEILRLANRKNLEVIAEFCENKEIVDAAIELGVDYLQGYHFSKPEPFEKKL